MLKVLVFNEFVAEKYRKNVAEVYPQGIHKAIAAALECDEISVKTTTLDDENCGISKELLDKTDVLIWWGHEAHDKVSDEVAQLVVEAVQKGMGFIALHSSHIAKPFKRLMGTSCTLKWREDDREILWVTAPAHPIALGLPEYIQLPKEEMYGEFFDIPKPDDIVFLGWYSGGEVFRSGCTFTRGYGKIFYFQPGHEEYPIYYNDNIIKILKNAVIWATPLKKREQLDCPSPEPIEKSNTNII